VRGDGDFGLGAGAQAAQVQDHVAVGIGGGLQRIEAARAFEDRDRAAILKRRQHLFAVVARQPVGEPEGVEATLGQGGDEARHLFGTGLPGVGHNAGQRTAQAVG